MTKNEYMFTSQMSLLIVYENSTTPNSRQRVCIAAGAEKKRKKSESAIWVDQ